MTARDRFKLLVAANSNNVWGWNGWVKDNVTGKRHPLIKTFIDYELQGEVGYGTCAFDTKDEMIAAAKRKARNIMRAGA